MFLSSGMRHLYLGLSVCPFGEVLENFQKLGNWDSDPGSGIGNQIENWELGLGLVIGTEDWDWGLELGIGIRYWDWILGFGIGIGIAD